MLAAPANLKDIAALGTTPAGLASRQQLRSCRAIRRAAVLAVAATMGKLQRHDQWQAAREQLADVLLGQGAALGEVRLLWASVHV